MKKKIILAVSIMLVAITACAMLVGCVPDRPDKFLLAWIDSDHMATKVGGSETGIDGNKMIEKLDDNNQIIYEKKSDKVNVYICVAGTWTAKSMTIEEAEKDENYVDITVNVDKDKAKEQYKKYTEAFEENFEKDDEGWWKSKNALAAVLVQMKVDGNELILRTGKLETMRLVLNYKISIPQEAKDALK